MKKKFIWISVAIVLIIVLFLILNMGSKNAKVLLETNHGNITLEIYSSEMPITAGNFQKLVEEGFYDGVIFHRVIENFMIQGGDPTGTGRGGPNYKIKTSLLILNLMKIIEELFQWQMLDLTLAEANFL
jgi:hypothetical protein